uniref:Uncharacterized protein n=1 Tax=Myoviridae sp. ctAys2 TaxID=2825044 RepID=A0A8S5Q431_9CAUD|nr:MAG TPA: hypothetical protein [Myoviridae sp. ctAys2]
MISSVHLVITIPSIVAYIPFIHSKYVNIIIFNYCAA